jgi:hypothetical protein
MHCNNFYQITSSKTALLPTVPFVSVPGAFSNNRNTLKPCMNNISASFFEQLTEEEIRFMSFQDSALKNTLKRI